MPVKATNDMTTKKDKATQHSDDAWWDYYSDQPYILRHSQKPRLSASSICDGAKTLATTLAYAPALAMKFAKAKQPPLKKSLADFIGVGIQPNDQHHDALLSMVDELGLQHLLLRVPSWQPENFAKLRAFIDEFPNQSFIINVLQSKEMVESPATWQRRIDEIFTLFGDRVSTFQIANASNRSKWGCAHISEYLDLHEICERVRDEHYPNIRLLGASIIDFEPLVSIRSLINFRDINYDGCALALYVNRRLSPYNKQFNYFDLEQKIRLAYATWQQSNRRSSQADEKLWITETNWPLLNTKPYTPNSGNPRSTVDEPTQAQFLKEYINIAYQTGMVERVYWWQLINPGYGLVDHRSHGEKPLLRKMPSFYALKTLLQSNTPN